MGFEDIAVDSRHRHVFCLIETLEDSDGTLRSFVAEYDSAGSFVRCTRLQTGSRMQTRGLKVSPTCARAGREYLYALCEGNLGTAAKRGGGRIDVFVRTQDQGWSASHEIRLPKQAEFEDYAALAYATASSRSFPRPRRACGSPGSTRKARGDPGSDTIYRFPSKSYGNVEGIAWLTADTLSRRLRPPKEGTAQSLRREGSIDPPVKDPCGMTEILPCPGGGKRRTPITGHAAMLITLLPPLKSPACCATALRWRPSADRSRRGLPGRCRLRSRRRP